MLLIFSSQVGTSGVHISVPVGIDDPAVTDAVDETEDHNEPHMMEEDQTLERVDPNAENNEQDESEDGPECHPNNDFCFTEADFLETRNQMNDATRHHGSYHAAWDRIQSLEGQVVETTNSKFGNMKWTVVKSDSITDDVFKIRRKEEVRSLEENILPMREEDDTNTFTDQTDFNASFWCMWPTSIEDDLDKLNEAIVLDNENRRQNYQRVIRMVSKVEYIKFHALLIGATAYSEIGERLWASDVQNVRKKRRNGLSRRVDFGKYMKQWRFKQIRQYIPAVMEDKTIKEIDDWWRFASRVTKFNNVRKNLLKSSHVHVFDESMSAYVPRLVSIALKLFLQFTTNYFNYYFIYIDTEQLSQAIFQICLSLQENQSH